MIVYSTQTTGDPYTRNTEDDTCKASQNDFITTESWKPIFLLSRKIQTNSKTRFVNWPYPRFTDKIHGEPYIVHFPPDDGSPWTSYPRNSLHVGNNFWNGSANKTNGQNSAPSCAMTRVSDEYVCYKCHQVTTESIFYPLLSSSKQKIKNKKNHRTVWAHGSVYFK